MLEINTLLRTPNKDVALKDLPTLATLYDQHNNEIKAGTETIKEDLGGLKGKAEAGGGSPDPIVRREPSRQSKEGLGWLHSFPA